MRQHEINKRKKLKQKRRESSKSQVEKKHKRKFKGKRRAQIFLPIYIRFGTTIPSKLSAFSKVNLNDKTRHNLELINSGVSAFKTLTCS